MDGHPAVIVGGWSGPDRSADTSRHLRTYLPVDECLSDFASSDPGSLFPTLVLHVPPVFQEEYAAQFIMVRRFLSPPKGEYIRADLSMRFAFPLQPRRYDFGEVRLSYSCKGLRGRFGHPDHFGGRYKRHQRRWAAPISTQTSVTEITLSHIGTGIKGCMNIPQGASMSDLQSTRSNPNRKANP